MQNKDAQAFFTRGLEALGKNNTPVALTLLEKACILDSNPEMHSYLAYCLAKERGQIKKALALCEDAIIKDPRNVAHYLNLGKIYLLARKKSEAISIFRKGLDLEENQLIIKELAMLGVRRSPVIASLPRNHPINKYLGLLLKKIGLR